MENFAILKDQTGKQYGQRNLCKSISKQKLSTQIFTFITYFVFIQSSGELQSLIPTVKAEVVNIFNTSNLAITRGNYTQVRIAGFGFDDESLDSDISRVQVDMTIETDGNRGLVADASLSFDVIAFDDQEDYLCFVEAVHLMIHTGVIKRCKFVNDDDVMKAKQLNFEYNDNKFLSFSSRNSEIFIVIDNTEFFKAQTDPEWKGPPKPRAVDGSEDVFVQIWFKTKYTSNAKYKTWTNLFILLLIIFGSALVITFGFYVYYRVRYMMYAKERKQIKRELMKIKDTEYNNFLLTESEAYKNLKAWDQNHQNAINKSQEQDQPDELDMDDGGGTDDSY